MPLGVGLQRTSAVMGCSASSAPPPLPRSALQGPDPSRFPLSAFPWIEIPRVLLCLWREKEVEGNQHCDPPQPESTARWRARAQRFHPHRPHPRCGCGCYCECLRLRCQSNLGGRFWLACEWALSVRQHLACRLSLALVFVLPCHAGSGLLLLLLAAAGSEGWLAGLCSWANQASAHQRVEETRKGPPCGAASLLPHAVGG